MGKLVKILSLSAAALGLVGLAIHLNRQWVLITNYCYKITGVRFLTLKTNDVDIDITLKVRNQSDIDIVIKRYEFKIYIDTYYVCDVVNETGFLFAANNVSVIPVKIKFNPQALSNRLKAAEIINLVAKVLTDKDNITIKIEGHLAAKHSFISLPNLPLNVSMTIKEIMATDPNALACKV